MAAIAEMAPTQRAPMRTEIKPMPSIVLSPKVELSPVAPVTPVDFEWNNCVGERSLMRRADQAIMALNEGSSILNLGTEAITNYRHFFAERKINVVESTSDTFEEAKETGHRFDMVIGNLDARFDLPKAFADIRKVMKTEGELYVDVYDNTARETELTNDELDDTLIDANFYVQASDSTTQRKTDTTWWQVRAIATEPIDPKHMPLGIKPRQYHTGPDWHVEQIDRDRIVR